jgi:hypothetical protein
MALFPQTNASFFQKFVHKIGFWEKRQFFRPTRPMLWFLKHFRRKILRKNWRFLLKTKLCKLFKKFDHNIGVWEKLGKIAENSDHNIFLPLYILPNIWLNFPSTTRVSDHTVVAKGQKGRLSGLRDIELKCRFPTKFCT